MQLKYADLAAVKSAGLLPAFAYALLAAVVVSAAAGAWAGWKLRGASAVAEENGRLQAEIAALYDAANEIRVGAVESARKFDAAVGRQEQIANAWETEREQARRFNLQQRTALAALLDARPDLRSDRAGDDVVRHWRASNTGAAADPAAAGTAGQPDAALPEPAATGGRPLGDVGRKPRRRRGAVPRMRRDESKADRCGARVGTDGVAVVLRRDEAHRHRGHGLCT